MKVAGDHVYSSRGEIPAPPGPQPSMTALWIRALFFPLVIIL